MCGLFFNYNKNRISSSNKKLLKKIAGKYLSKRGPDGMSEKYGENWYALHSLLSITHNKETQPIKTKDFIFLYNGEMYNDWKRYSKNYGDVDFFTKHLNKYGLNGLDKLDGEYALILFDYKKNFLYLATDPFGTKPLHYAIKKKTSLIVTTYTHTIQDLNVKEKDITKVKPNTLIRIDLNKNFKIKKYPLIKKFNFNTKNKTNYNDFSKAFSDSIKKRTQNLVDKKVFLGLSSGHDSGVIAAELNNLKIPFSSYSVFYGEVPKILNQRIKILKKNKRNKLKTLKIHNKIRNKIKNYLFKFSPYVNIKVDDPIHYGDGDYRKNPGFISTAHIINTAKKDGCTINLSSQGADEIISDFYNEHTHSRKSCLKGNWKKATKPWKNFYGGWLAAFIHANECMGGTLGIETRFPFLDYKLIQTFLSLPHNEKAKVYKAPITNILKKHKFPYHNFKIGFYGYKVKNINVREKY